MNKVNKARLERRERDDRVYGSHHSFIKEGACDVRLRQRANGSIHECGFFADRPNIEGHHIKSVGSGGEDRNNEVPLCPAAHDEAHSLSVSDWCRLYHRDFKSVAAIYTEQFDELED